MKIFREWLELKEHAVTKKNSPEVRSKNDLSKSKDYPDNMGCVKLLLVFFLMDRIGRFGK